MIIFGTRSVTTTLEKGSFYCPHCDQRASYRHQKVTKFFTLYFIPLIPIKTLGDYVECDKCNCSFVKSVLHAGNRSGEHIVN